MGMWASGDLYPGGTGMAKNQTVTPTTAQKTNTGAAVKAAPAPAWLALVVLFIVFRVVYEMAGD